MNCANTAIFMNSLTLVSFFDVVELTESQLDEEEEEEDVEEMGLWESTLASTYSFTWRSFSSLRQARSKTSVNNNNKSIYIVPDQSRLLLVASHTCTYNLQLYERQYQQ